MLSDGGDFVAREFENGEEVWISDGGNSCCTRVGKDSGTIAGYQDGKYTVKLDSGTIAGHQDGKYTVKLGSGMRGGVRGRNIERKFNGSSVKHHIHMAFWGTRTYHPRLIASEPHDVIALELWGPRLRALMNVIRCVTAWVFLVSFVLSISMFTGYALEVYFNAKRSLKDQNGFWEDGYRLLVCSSPLRSYFFLPFLVVAMALFGDKMLVMVFDAFDLPPLAEMAACLLTSPIFRKLYINLGFDVLYTEVPKWVRAILLIISRLVKKHCKVVSLAGEQEFSQPTSDGENQSTTNDEGAEKQGVIPACAILTGCIVAFVWNRLDNPLFGGKTKALCNVQVLQTIAHTMTQVQGQCAEKSEVRSAMKVIATMVLVPLITLLMLITLYSDARQARLGNRLNRLPYPVLCIDVLTTTGLTCFCLIPHWNEALSFAQHFWLVTYMIFRCRDEDPERKHLLSASSIILLFILYNLCVSPCHWMPFRWTVRFVVLLGAAASTVTQYMTPSHQTAADDSSDENDEDPLICHIKPPPMGLCLCVDLIAMWKLLLYPLYSGYIQLRSYPESGLHSFILGMNRGYITAALSCVGFFFLADADVRRFTRQDTKLFGCKVRTITYCKELHEVFQDMKIFPGALWLTSTSSGALCLTGGAFGRWNLHWDEHFKERWEDPGTNRESRDEQGPVRTGLRVSRIAIAKKHEDHQELEPPQLHHWRYTLAALLPILGIVALLALALLTHFNWQEAGRCFWIFVSISSLYFVLRLRHFLIMLGLDITNFLTCCATCTCWCFREKCDQGWRSCKSKVGKKIVGHQRGKQEQASMAVGGDFIRRIVVVVLAVSIWVCAMVAVMHFSSNKAVASGLQAVKYFFIMGAPMVFLVWRLARLFALIRHGFWFILIFFTTTATMFQIGPLLDKNTINSSHAQAFMTYGQNESVWNTWYNTGLNISRAVPYQICGQRWGHAELSVLDLAELANIAYDNRSNCDAEDSAMIELLNESFNGTVQIISCDNYSSVPRTVHFYFPPSGMGKQGTHVFSIKGTSTIDDVYLDTSLFGTVQVLQRLSQVLPVLSVWPLESIQDNVKWISQVGGSNERNMFKKLENRILDEMKKKREYAEDAIVLTGHSLGGGIAQIVANRAGMGWPAVVFSAPGIIYSAKRFEVSLETAERGTVVVIPDNDLVPRVDAQAGLIQRIACRDAKNNFTNADVATCHSLRKTACELWRSCGDFKRRDFSVACNELNDPSYGFPEEWIGKNFDFGKTPWTSPDGRIL